MNPAVSGFDVRAVCRLPWPSLAAIYKRQNED